MGGNRIFSLAALLVSLSVFPAPLSAQLFDEPTAEGISTQFQRWVAEGERKELDWQVQVTKPQLAMHQRVRVGIFVRLDGKQLNRQGSEHDLFLLARVADSDGTWLGDGEELLRARLNQPIPRRSLLEFPLYVYLLPGDYSLGLVLYDRVTGLRSVTRRALRVEPLKNDPLPDAWRLLPRVQFIHAGSPVPANQIYEVFGRLWLPVVTSRPLRVEVLINFSPSELYTGRRTVERSNTSLMLSTLHVLSQLEIPNGSLRVTGLDLIRREVVFDQEPVSALDWPRLEKALAERNAGVIGAQQLAGRKQNPAFFREVLAERLAEEPPHAAGGSPAQTPVRVFIVVSSSMLFAHRSDSRPLKLSGNCDCRAFYLRFQIPYSNVFDQLRKIMDPLDPRQFVMTDAHHLRESLAKILADLRKL